MFLYLTLYIKINTGSSKSVTAAVWLVQHYSRLRCTGSCQRAHRQVAVNEGLGAAGADATDGRQVGVMEDGQLHGQTAPHAETTGRKWNNKNYKHRTLWTQHSIPVLLAANGVCLFGLTVQESWCCLDLKASSLSFCPQNRPELHESTSQIWPHLLRGGGGRERKNMELTEGWGRIYI